MVNLASYLNSNIELWLAFLHHGVRHALVNRHEPNGFAIRMDGDLVAPHLDLDRVKA